MSWLVDKLCGYPKCRKSHLISKITLKVRYNYYLHLKYYRTELPRG